MENNEIKAAPESPEFSASYILSKIDEILADKKHLGEAMEKLGGLCNSENSVDGSKGAVADAIRGVVADREATNQQIIALLNKMYDDLKPSEETKKFQGVCKVLEQLPDDFKVQEIAKKIAQQMFVKAGCETV